jgi:hypothetical protein
LRRAFRVSGVTIVAWKEGAARVLCRLTKREEQEAQEAIRRGDSERVARICRGAERTTQAIGYERQALEWQETRGNGSWEGTQKESPREEKSGEEVQRLKNEWIKALGREALKREAERMRSEWNELQETRDGGASTTVEEEEAYRRAFDEEAVRLFPRRRQDEMMRIVMNRERFERVTEARFQATKPQESWMFQTASESRGGGASRNEGLGRGWTSTRGSRPS